MGFSVELSTTTLTTANGESASMCRAIEPAPGVNCGTPLPITSSIDGPGNSIGIARLNIVPRMLATKLSGAALGALSGARAVAASAATVVVPVVGVVELLFLQLTEATAARARSDPLIRPKFIVQSLH
jgi:hypothetical protein